MTSDEKTLLPSLMKLINSDLFTFKNISSSITLEVSEPDILMSDTSKWDAVISYLPLEFFRVITSIDGMVTTEDFEKKYIRNPKMCAYDKYGTTNMWRPLMILNKCPRIMDFNFQFIKHYNIEKLSNVIALLISRVRNE